MGMAIKLIFLPKFCGTFQQLCTWVAVCFSLHAMGPSAGKIRHYSKEGNMGLYPSSEWPSLCFIFFQLNKWNSRRIIGVMRALRWGWALKIQITQGRGKSSCPRNHIQTKIVQSGPSSEKNYKPPDPPGYEHRSRSSGDGDGCDWNIPFREIKDAKYEICCIFQGGIKKTHLTEAKFWASWKCSSSAQILEHTSS